MEKINSKKMRELIFQTVMRKWPTHVSEVARELKLFPDGKDGDKAVIARIKYHFDQLARDHRINVKRIDRALVAWPTEVERYRTIHEILGGI